MHRLTTFFNLYFVMVMFRGYLTRFDWLQILQVVLQTSYKSAPRRNKTQLAVAGKHMKKISNSVKKTAGHNQPLAPLAILRTAKKGQTMMEFALIAPLFF